MRNLVLFTRDERITGEQIVKYGTNGHYSWEFPLEKTPTHYMNK